VAPLSNMFEPTIDVRTFDENLNNKNTFNFNGVKNH
jgi:hypothetical protein